MSRCIRHMLTRYANKLKTDLTQISEALDAGNVSSEELLTFQFLIQSSKDSIDNKSKAYDAYLASLQGEAREAEEGVFDDFVARPDNFVDIVMQADACLVRINVLKQSFSLDISERAPAQVVNVNNNELPNLPLPQFDGNVLEWNTFWVNFRDSVDSRDIPNVKKFKYLNNCLTGQPKQIISSLPVTADNYELACDKLKSWFGDVDVIKRAAYNAIKTLPFCNDSLSDIKNFLVRVEKVYRQLSTLNENLQQCSILMDVESKIPMPILLELRRQSAQPWGLEVLLQELTHYVQLRERLSSPVNQMAQNNNLVINRGQNSRNLQRNGFVVTSLGVENQGRIICHFCRGNHFDDRCTSFPSLRSREKQALDLRLCFKCLRPGHRMTSCRFSKLCFYCSSKNHNRALCPIKFSQKSDTSDETPRNQMPNDVDGQMSTTAKTVISNPAVEAEEAGVSVNTACTDLNSKSANILLPTLHLSVASPGSDHQRDVDVLLDTGSERSFITKKLAADLKLEPLGVEFLKIFTFGSLDPASVRSNIYEIELRGKSGSSKILIVHAVPHLIRKIRRQIVKTRDAIGSSEWGNVELLIGSDYCWELFKGAKISLAEDNLYEIITKVGTFRTGSYRTLQPTISSPSVHANSCFTSSQFSSLTDIKIEQFWDLENIGVTESPFEKDDEKALKQFLDTVAFVNGRYEVRWPWKNQGAKLANNVGLCLGRLKSILKRFEEIPNLLERYNEVMEDQLRKGIIEEVEATNSDNVIYYMPHQPVLNENKSTTKVRIVYDATAKSNKSLQSLNEALFRGPILLPDLCGMQLRARSQKYLVAADIEKAYLQISLNPLDRDTTRFFWLKDLRKGFSFQNLVTYRFKRIAFGIVSSAFLLNAVIRHHLNTFENSSDNYLKETAKQLKSNIYVDNILLNVHNLEDALNLYKLAKLIFKQAGMNIREWFSNVPGFNDELPLEDRAKSEAIIKLLGLKWDVVNDRIIIELKLSKGITVWSKRNILHSVASVYDPLGLISPITLQGKILFQACCKEKLNWDEPINSLLKQQWENLQSNWGICSSISVERVAVDNFDKAAELHIFVDASQVAYAAVVYLRKKLNTNFKTGLIFSKARLNPCKDITIPKLELLAILIGARVGRFVSNELSLSNTKIILWSDSETALNWIFSTKILPRFVENRVRQIRNYGNIEFRHVEGAENPADLASRGCEPTKLKESKIWWQGPSWLAKEESFWPISKNFLPCSVNEVQNNDVMVPAVISVNNIFQNYKASSWTKLCRIFIFMLRFLKIKIWNKISNRNKEKLKCIGIFREKGSIVAEEVASIRTLIIKAIQKSNFSEVFYSLNHNTPNQLVENLGLRLSDGILRCYGRYEKASLKFSARAPILLPSQGQVTMLIILEVHKQMAHASTQITLAELRQNFWVLKGRKTVKETIKKCRECQRFRAKPYSLPPMPPLPHFRTCRALPFQFTGLDYFGPMTVKLAENKIKIWTCLFTCLTTRAVHLEVVTNLSTEMFLNAFRRFLARRGTPSVIISDNASTFKGANQVFQKTVNTIFTSDETVRFFANKIIKWRFITPLSPWRGGFYERMVGVVKTSLKRAIGKKLITLEQYATLICEVEAITNSRPLTHLYDDVQASVLRPVDFFMPFSHICVSMSRDVETSEEDPTYVCPEDRDVMVDMYEKSKDILGKFWKLWEAEYLLSLREKQRMVYKQGRAKTDREPEVGDVVIVKEEDAGPGEWKLAKVTQLIPDFDGRVRSVTLEKADKKEFQRSIAHIYPLEINEKEQTD